MWINTVHQLMVKNHWNLIGLLPNAYYVILKVIHFGLQLLPVMRDWVVDPMFAGLHQVFLFTWVLIFMVVPQAACSC